MGEGSQPQEKIMQLKKIPTTIITGFLGSGKTTLVRHILENANGLRIAVIVNEFGELGIDGEILKSCGIGCDDETSGRLYELANGCVCCTVQEEFFPVMKELVARRADIDHILIETSGLALPKPLVQAFNWPEIRNACTVDSVITVVDTPAVLSGLFAANPEAVNAQRQADPNLDHESPLHELFEDQLSAADLVILNKTDLVDAAQIRDVEALVREELPPQVKIVHAEQSKLALEVLLGLNSRSEEFIDQREGHHDHDEDHDHDEFQSVVLRLPIVEKKPLLDALEELVQHHGILRIKGFVALPDKPMRLVLQGVGRRFDSYFDRRWNADETPHTYLVFIGQELSADVLLHELQQKLALAETN
jgi:cobalamin biosynthesis protein CobW